MTVLAEKIVDYRFAGRVFRPAVPMSAWQVGYFAAHLRAAKVETYVLPSQAGHVESFDELVERLMVSMHLYHLLAAALVEVVDGGVVLPWSNVTADEIARHIAGLTHPEDIAALRPAIQEVLSGFFPRLPVSPGTSPNSSSPATPTANPRGTAASSTSAAGPTSPAPSRGTTGTARKRSSGGRRARSASPTATDSAPPPGRITGT